MPYRKLTAAGGSRMEDWSAGDWGGLFAGFVAALAGLGKGVAWLLDWNRNGLSAREVRLSKWEANLVNRERAYREEIEGQLAATRTELGRVELEVGVLREVLGEVTAELHRHAPDSPALTRAAKAMIGGN